MTKPVSPALNNNKWLLGLITLFAVIMLFGFIPWEYLFSIQINNNTLAWLTDFPVGLFGLFGLLCTAIIYLMRSKKRFSIALSISLSILSIPIACVTIINFMIPTFHWYDKDVYRNANDYLVIQEQETFVTSNETYP